MTGERQRPGRERIKFRYQPTQGSEKVEADKEEQSLNRIDNFPQYKIHITLEITEVTKVPVVAGILLVPLQVVGVDGSVPGMAAAIGVVHGSVMGQAQNRAAGKLGAPVEGIPRRGKETRVTGTGTSTLQHCRG